jgi:hypothetical protein
MIEIPALVATTWAMLKPFLPIIATKATEEISKMAVGKVWTAIEKKFDIKVAAKETLQDLLKNPQDEDVQGAFRLQLKKILEEDNSFASDLSKLLESAGSDYKTQIIGNGAIAQGKNAKSVGAGGVMIDGGVTSSNIVMGNNNMVNAERKTKKK